MPIKFLVLGRGRFFLEGGDGSANSIFMGAWSFQTFKGISEPQKKP